MIRHIDLTDDTARRLEQLQALTGQSVEAIIDSALRVQLAQVETDALREAISLGAAEADAGAFTDLTVDEIFAQGMARAKQAAPDRN